MKVMRVAVVIFVSLLIVELLLVPYRSWLKTEQTRQLHRAGATITADILNELSEPIYISIGVASYIQSLQGDVAEFRLDAWLGALFEHTRHTRNIGIAPDNEIQFIYPLEGNEAALGLRYQDIEEQWQDIQRLMDTGQPQFIGPIELVQGGQAFAYRVPVFIDSTYWGLISTIIDAESIYDAIAKHLHGYEALQLQLENSNGVVFLSLNGDIKHNSTVSSKNRVPLPSADWQLRLYQELDTRNLMIARVVGFVIVALFFFGLWWLLAKNREHKREQAALHASKLQFLASVSHELKTPLTILQGSLKMLAEANLSEGKKRSLIVTAGNHQKRLNRLILDLLDLNLAMNDQLNVHYEKVDLIAFVKLLLETYKDEFDQAQLRLNLRLPEGEIFIKTDKERLRQVLCHLIENAIKFSPPKGSIEVSVQKDEVLSLTVSDSGPGLPLKYLEQNSFVFTQLDGSDIRRYGGTGIGLALCKELCELLQARLELNNNTHGGARVSVCWSILASEKK